MVTFREEVIELLANKVLELYPNTDPSTLNADTRFKEDLGIKSSDIVKITAALEDEYDVEVAFMAFNRCVTFGAAADYMSEITGIE